ncbi:hypothetical protein [Mesorhizobium sp. J428]|uniref:hypothetical protein n=1 Tax=Mesorhizobium sp. J428 TaxID=2898440 RepID=UPI0021508B1C|nr:hypothetical protein [Mesorhizobium sp. J428]MCR5856520.1 hypothetical protein [Mesorhizobium sp. J428]
MTTEKVLGTAEYRAVRSPLEGTVTLTAAGILPCMNYSAQLEMRPERIMPPMWDMVFFVQPLCLTAMKPFEISVVIAGNAAKFDVIRVMDATGWVEVPVVDPFVPVNFAEAQAEAARFLVYARLPFPPGSTHSGCIVVPEGTLVPAIYYRAFGPASRQECDAWLLKNCGAFKAAPAGTPGGDVPWPRAPQPAE